MDLAYVCFFFLLISVLAKKIHGKVLPLAGSYFQYLFLTEKTDDSDMMRLQNILFFLLFILGSPFLFGQVKDSVYILPAAEIQAFRSGGFQTGVKTTHIDSVVLSDYHLSSLSVLLNQQSSVFVKSYGTSYAGTSFRGMSAAHTGIYWNDIPLGSPMLGLTDLSLLPVSAGDYIDIRHGGGSAAFGSGNAGGSIHIDSKPEFIKRNKLGIQQSIGSFGAYTGSLHSVNGNERWQSSSKMIFNKSENNFIFTDLFSDGYPKKRLSHAESSRASLIQDFYYRAKNNQTLSLHAWYQGGMRNIPATMSMSMSKASEEEQSMRASAEWKQLFATSGIQLMTAYSYNHLLYRDPTTGIFSDSYYHTTFSKAAYDYAFDERFQLHTGINLTYSSAYVNEYGMKRNQGLVSLYASIQYRIKSGKFKSTLALRRDYAELFTCPMTPFAGLEMVLYKSFGWYANAGRNFRIPTFNDLFWRPGGNPSLKPENGISSEAGFSIDNTKSHQAFTYEMHASGFYSSVQDWIIWLPAGGMVWSPQNMKSVMGRGLEYEGMLAFQRKDFRLHLSGSYAFTLSDNQNKTDLNYGRQLIYVPYENANASIRLEYKGYLFSLHESYTGGRYVSPDHSEILPAYQLLNMSAGKFFVFGNYLLRMGLDVNNLCNTSYQSVQWIPMPGRSYGFKIGIEFN